MQVKDKFLEKINFLVFFFILFVSNNLIAENLHDKIFNYNDKLKNSSANFIQTSSNNLQEGKIFFGKNRIKIVYEKPQKITIILSEKKGAYINHELRESHFFATKKSYVRFFFDVFNKRDHIEKINIKNSYNKIEVSEKIEIDRIFYNVKLTYENEPIKLRLLEIKNEEETIQMGFFDHKKEGGFEKKFFSMADPYLN